MALFQSIVTYFFLFVTMYVEVFMLVVLFSNRKKVRQEAEDECENLARYPTVTVIVPCYNEEKTVEKTLDSLMALEYPKDKLTIIAVDDGSKDRTWEIIQAYRERHPEIRAFHKENGGKHTALNLGIENSTSEFVGCLDSDSFVHPRTLKKLMRRFEEDPEAMAVTPALRIHKPSTLVQFVQSAEYYLGILSKKVQSFMGAIHVTPGPFTIFRREVFERIGVFRPAHNLEDMEMAFRMQKNRLKIDNVHNAWVYTVGPNTITKLYKQRLRWTHGFIENAKDYKELFFNPRYGNVSFLTLPTAALFLLAVVFWVVLFAYRTGKFVWYRYLQWKTVGFVYPHVSLQLFYVSAKLTIILSAITLLLTVTLLVTAHKLAEGRARVTKNILLYLLVYPLISPLWVLRSIYNSVFAKKTSWR